MAAVSTYTPIQSVTLTTTTATVTLNSIPSTYTDLIIVYSGTTNSTNKDVRLNVNNDTASNYSWTALAGQGTAVGSYRLPNASNFAGYQLVGTVSNPATIIYNFQNYANTSVYKSTLYRVSDAGAEVEAYAGLWRSTSAINRVDFTSSSGASFVSGTTITLYGIAAA